MPLGKPIAVDRAISSRVGTREASVQPALTRTGRVLALGGLLNLAFGVVWAAPLTVALGLVQLFALWALYLHFHRAAIELARGKLEIAWRLFPGWGTRRRPVVGDRFKLEVRLRHHGFQPLRVIELKIVSSSALETEVTLLHLSTNEEATLTMDVRANGVGHLFLHGAVVELQDALRLFSLVVYFPAVLTLDVWPSAALKATPLRDLEGAGRSQSRPSDSIGEPGAIRPFQSGDRIRHIVWKASARKGRLVVRELDQGGAESWQFVLDVSPSMRAGPPGRRGIDLAIEKVASLALARVAASHRVGLCAYFHGAVRLVNSASGAIQRWRLLKALMLLANPVEEALTSATATELCGVVARYLRIQEGVDVYEPSAPAPGDRRWSGIAVTSTGELINLELLANGVRALLKKSNDSPEFSNPLIRNIGTDTGLLREFCRARGIELLSSMDGSGVTTDGLREAISLAAHSRWPQRILVASCGPEWLSPALSATLRAAKRRGHEVRRLTLDTRSPATSKRTAAAVREFVSNSFDEGAIVS
jgi:uncharacterized protein (DUF58 family)